MSDELHDGSDELELLSSNRDFRQLGTLANKFGTLFVPDPVYFNQCIRN